MPKRKSTFEFPLFERAPRTPRRQWLYEQFRSAILDGRCKPGARLPSSRTLAEQYGIARGTVVEAFAQLTAEGYVRSGVGSGTFVSDALPDQRLQSDARARRARTTHRTAPAVALSRRGTAMAQPSPFAGADQRAGALFDPYLPALDEFPKMLWARLLARRMRTSNRSLLGECDARGYAPLRQNIAHYLGMARGIRTTPERILVLPSVQQALDLSVRLLLDEGDTAWMEDPGYPGARAIFRQAGVRPVSVPVDGSGIQVEFGKRCDGSARFAYVTPARQAPLGVGLALSRRMELLEWAAQSGAWIFEDDYDGEYRYEGRPLAALQSIDPLGRVLYAGSFSKTLFPALRISFLVLPDSLVDAFTAARSVVARFAPLLEQAVLSDYIEHGHYARHVRRMNVLYAERRAAMIAAIAAAPRVFESVSGDDAGLSLVAWLATGRTEREALRAARSRQQFVQPLAPYAVEQRHKPGLVLGFAAATPAQLRYAVKAFAAAMG